MSGTIVPQRTLGKNGPKVPALGFGLGGLSLGYGLPPGDEERFAVLDRAVELGAIFWDTADIYADNEEFLGKWFKRTGKRNEIFLATKFGIRAYHDANAIDSSPEYCKQACYASLRKMGVDYIDLFYVHKINKDIPIEQTMRAMVELQKEGKIKHIGLSEVSSTTLRRAVKIAPVAAVQVEYSPFVLSVENEEGTNILSTCRELGVSVVCYSPLGKGMLGGSLTSRDSVTGQGDMRATYFPRFSEENLDSNLKAVERFKELAVKVGCTPAQLSLAWLLKQGPETIPIPGTKKVKYLEDNWGALNVKLSDEQEAEVRKFVESVEMKGDRTTAAGMAVAFGDTKEEV